MFSNFFPKIVPFIRQCREIWWSQRGRKSHYSSYALNAGSVRLHARKYTPAPLHLEPPPHTHTPPRKYTYCFSMPTVVLWTRLIVGLCVHYLSCLITFSPATDTFLSETFLWLLSVISLFVVFLSLLLLHVVMLTLYENAGVFIWRLFCIFYDCYTVVLQLISLMYIV